MWCIVVGNLSNEVIILLFIGEKFFDVLLIMDSFVFNFVYNYCCGDRKELIEDISL